MRLQQDGADQRGEVVAVPEDHLQVVWEKMSPAQRYAYEREHGVPPPGYRGTGPVEWFARRHPDTAPCVGCGRETSRWEIQRTSIGKGGPPSATYNGRSLLGVPVPCCTDCDRRQAIVRIERRLQAADLHPEARPRLEALLVELRAMEAAA